MRNKKIIISGIVIVSAIVVFSYRVSIRNMKINRIESLYADFLEDYTKQVDIMVELNSFKKDSDKKVVETAIKYHQKISQNSIDKAIIDRVTSRLEDLKRQESSGYYIEDLKKINTDSEYYEEAQSLIAELSKFEDTSSSNSNNYEESQSSSESNKNSNDIETDSKITITYYTKHYTAGNEKLNIKVKNTSGKDIRYLALDIVEVDKSGNVVNSDWTNTSALIVDGAMVSMDTYFDYQRSDSDLEFRVREIRYK